MGLAAVFVSINKPRIIIHGIIRMCVVVLFTRIRGRGVRRWLLLKA